MKMNKNEIFLEENSFEFIEKIREGERPWSAISKIDSIISAKVSGMTATENEYIKTFARIEKPENRDGSIHETTLLIKQTKVLDRPIFLEGAIFIDEGTYLETGAVIKAPAIIGKGSEIRQGAYLRGKTIVGKNSVIGHVTEMKNSIVMDNSAAGHFAYVGDSILGSGVNLGAGVKIANLQFRNRDEIDNGYIREISIKGASGTIATGRSKLGAVVGDYTEIGCNSVTTPGTILGAECWIYPNSTISKNFYARKSILK
jgi:NDP-sugar pyrophosphorylase family protein